jgi:hypothetical protein
VYLIGGVAVAVFIIVAGVLGAAVLFVAVAFLIGPHGGILPEWSNSPVLVLLAGGVGYVSYKAATWTQLALARRTRASNDSLERTRER